MLKNWYEKRPFTFGAVFIFFYMTIPIVDQLFIYPKINPTCVEQLQQPKTCASWIITKETKHVSETTISVGGVYRSSPFNSEFEWKGTLDTPSGSQIDRK